MAGKEETKDKALAEKAYEAAASKTPTAASVPAANAAAPQAKPTPVEPAPSPVGTAPSGQPSQEKPVVAPAAAPTVPPAAKAEPVSAKISAPASVPANTPAAKAPIAPAPKKVAKVPAKRAAKVAVKKPTPAPVAKPVVAAAPKAALAPKALPPVAAKSVAPKAVAPKAIAAEKKVVPVKPAAVKPVPEVAKAKPAPVAAKPTVPTSKAAIKTAEANTIKFAGLFTPFILEENTMDMSANFAGFQDAVTEAQAKAKAAFEKSTATLGEVGDFAKGNVEAVIESGKIFAEGIQGIGSELVAESRSAFETFTGDIKELAAAKSPNDFFKIQGDLARKNFDTAVAYGSKNSEALLKLVSDAFAPISGRVSVAVEKARHVAA